MSYVARWHADDGNHIVLATDGRKHIHLVVIDYPVRHVSLPKQEGRHIFPLDYPVAKGVRLLRKFGKQNGITRAAQRMLREA